MQDAGYSLKTDGKIPGCGSLIAVLALTPLTITNKSVVLEQQECVVVTAAMSCMV
jgi:hypothetical protein